MTVLTRSPAEPGRARQQALESIEWLSLQDLADWLGVSRAVIYNLRSRGRGPRGVRIGRELRFQRADVERWLESLRE